MIEYLQKYGGYNLNGLTLQEKKELEHLRVELKKYRQIEEQENREILVSEGSESESNNESKKSSRKESIEENEDENENENKSKSQSVTESDNEDDEDPQLGDLTKNQIKTKKNIQRKGVSAEAYGQFNKKEDFVARMIPKSEEQIQRIKSSVIHSFLFCPLASW